MILPDTHRRISKERLFAVGPDQMVGHRRRDFGIGEEPTCRHVAADTPGFGVDGTGRFCERARCRTQLPVLACDMSLSRPMTGLAPHPIEASLHDECSGSQRGDMASQTLAGDSALVGKPDLLVVVAILTGRHIPFFAGRKVTQARLDESLRSGDA